MTGQVIRRAHCASEAKGNFISKLPTRPGHQPTPATMRSRWPPAWPAKTALKSAASIVAAKPAARAAAGGGGADRTVAARPRMLNFNRRFSSADTMWNSPRGWQTLRTTNSPGAEGASLEAGLTTFRIPGGAHRGDGAGHNFCASANRSNLANVITQH